MSVFFRLIRGSRAVVTRFVYLRFIDLSIDFTNPVCRINSYMNVLTIGSVAFEEKHHQPLPFRIPMNCDTVGSLACSGINVFTHTHFTHNFVSCSESTSFFIRICRRNICTVTDIATYSSYFYDQHHTLKKRKYRTYLAPSSRERRTS